LIDSHITALQESSSASESITLCSKALGIATFAINVTIGSITAKNRVQRPLAISAGEAFLKVEA
jgi:hypothetical protein